MVDRNGRNVIDETNPPCNVVITPQIEIIKRNINYWKMLRNIMFVLFLFLLLYCAYIFIMYNAVVIIFSHLLPFIIGFIIGLIIGLIITEIIDTTKGKIYQIYYQSKEHINSKWVALPFFYNFQAKIYTELQENFPELNFVMEEAQVQTPSANNNIQTLFVSDYGFRTSIRMFHIQITHNDNNKEKVENLYTQKEIEYLILKYAKSYNVSAVVCNNIDETCVTYYNEFKSVIRWFWLWFWLWFFCFGTIIIIIVFLIIFYRSPPPPDLPPQLLNYPQYLDGPPPA